MRGSVDIVGEGMLSGYVFLQYSDSLSFEEYDEFFVSHGKLSFFVIVGLVFVEFFGLLLDEF